MASEQNPYSPPKVDETVARPDEAVVAHLDGPRGIGGWLVLPLLGLIVSPVRTAITCVRDFVPVFKPSTWAALTTPGGPGYHPLWVPVIVFELVGNVTLIAFTIFVLVRFLKKSRRVPRLMIILLLGIAGFLLLDHLLVGLIPALSAVPDAQSTTALSRSVVAAAIWIPYFLKSRRVRNTFVT